MKTSKYTEHTSFADDAWIVRLVDYVRDVYQNSQVPIVGICFGHQILARALGGQVSRFLKKDALVSSALS